MSIESNFVCKISYLVHYFCLLKNSGLKLFNLGIYNLQNLMLAEILLILNILKFCLIILKIITLIIMWKISKISFFLIILI